MILVHNHSEKCDYLCQLSLNQPDYRDRPAPHYQIPNSPMNFFAK